ncbi:MAG: endonuclease, partial [Planctomycetaceae bacterium]|nr:endonuclease [Planctomycetaceae bacterium]
NDWRNTLANASLATKGFHQLTSPPGQFRSFPSWLPVGALDKVFVNEGLQSHQARVVRTSLAREASDHLPVVVDFTISTN